VYTFTHYTKLFPVGIGVGILFSASIVCRFFVKKLQSHNFSFAIIIAFFTTIALIYMKELTAHNYRHSPGLDLANAVSYHVQKNELYYYKVPDECLSPVNFYMNRLIPEIRNERQLSKAFLSDKTIYCIAGRKAYEESSLFHHVPHTRIQDIRYKDIDLTLIVNQPKADQTEW
ncbi:MAG: hypothetical protein ACK41Q_11425, partial [Candidatus Brocadia sp.]